MKNILWVLLALGLGFTGCTEKQAAKTNATVERETKLFRKGMNRIGNKIGDIADDVKEDLRKNTNTNLREQKGKPDTEE